MERWEDHYGQGGLHSRNGLQIIIQCLHQEYNSINVPPDDPVRTQEGQIIEEPQVLQGGEGDSWTIVAPDRGPMSE